MVTKKYLVGLVFALVGLVFALVFLKPVFALTPSGGSVTEIRTETAPADAAGSDDAIAGNITEFTITGYTTTQSWQGYIGNVSGTIQLADSTDDILYNWSLAEPEGEVYATTNASVTWTTMQCLNYSASGSFGGSQTPGTINTDGINLSTLETTYNIASDDVDGVNETFFLYSAGGAGGGAGQHDLFYTANLQFSEGECISTRVFGSGGAGVNNQFEEVLLYDPSSRAVVFASLLEEGLLNGYDGNDHDFEMLVLDDGHGTDIATTTYYFFVELE